MPTVATIVLDGAHPFEFSVACEVFGLRRPELRVEWYDFLLCARSGRVRLDGGYVLSTGHDLSEAASADIILVPFSPVDADADSELLDLLGEAHGRGARLVSFCNGAFTLAQTGLLDGRRATTHWMHADAFRRRFPNVRLDPNVLFVDEGDVLTSAGTAAGIDLALHLVRMDYGAEVARVVARRMVVPPHRDGGQAQFIDPPHQAQVGGDGLAEVLDWLQARLDSDISVAQMAAHAAMSERTFARRFKEATGATPFRWLLVQRIRRAQELLERTDWDVDRVALQSGLGTAANLRLHLRRELDTTPSAYRRMFRGPNARSVTG